MAKAHNIELIPGNLMSCEACTIGKAKQKDVPKHTNLQPPETGRRTFLDIVTVKTPKGAPTISKPNWRIMVDQEFQLKISDFFETKYKMIGPTLAKIKKLIQNGIDIKVIRLDDAGKNKKMKKNLYDVSGS
jgi:hypothetical protein